MVFYTEQGSVAIKASIASASPLSVVVSSADVKLIAEGNRTLLILFDHKEYFKAEAVVTTVAGGDGDCTIQLSDELWEEVDRRRYPRVPTEVPVELRAIRESDGKAEVERFSGTTVDLSVGGAWVKLDHSIEPGSLVEAQFALSPQENVRILGVAAHRSGQTSGFGLEFVDFVGSARYVLHTYLSNRQAA